uniref:Uncharacterized protein n=1 Tax=Globodera rostochiensis TaxID=31243 RepID=A0A914H0S1_GLORO
MDVLIAYWLTSHVFWSYHQQFEMPAPQRTQSALSNVWWYWLCYWFETALHAHVGGQAEHEAAMIPTEFCCPQSIPSKKARTAHHYSFVLQTFDADAAGLPFF